MNGYELMAESYKKQINAGNIDKKEGEKKIRVFEFLATCDKADICYLVDSCAFNGIIEKYVSIALDEAQVPDNLKEEIIMQLRLTFEDLKAEEVAGK